MAINPYEEEDLSRFLIQDTDTSQVSGEDDLSQFLIGSEATTPRGPSTLQASFPMAAERKGRGIQETLGSVERWTGVSAPWLDFAGKSLEEYGLENLENYKPTYIDKPFLETGNKPGWIGETIQSQVGEMGVTYGLSYLGNRLPGMWGSAAKLTNVGQVYTGLVSEAQEDIARKSGKSVEELTDKEKNKAQFVAGANTVLELFAPRKLGKDRSPYKLGDSHKENLKTFDKITKDIKKEGIGKQAKTFAKEAGKIGAQEAGTEYLQGVVSSVASEPGLSYEISPQGLTEAVDRIVGGFAGGSTFSAPSAYGVARQPNRMLNQAQEQLRAQNRRNLLQAGQQFREQGIDYTPFQFNVAPRREIPFLSKLKNTGSHFLFNRATDLFQNKLTKLPQQLGRAPTGKDVDLLMNKLFSKFGDVETMSGDVQARPSYHTTRKNLLGEFVKPIDEIYNRWRSGGNIRGQFDPAIEAYIKAKLEGKDTSQLVQNLPEGTDVAQLDADAQVIRQTTDNIYERLNQVLSESDMSVGYTKNYIPRGINREAIQNNREGFINSLINDVGYTREQAERISNEIENGRDPTTLSAAEIEAERKGYGRKGEAKKGFEKQRSKAWDKLSDEFREQSVFKSIEDYAYKASQRIASAETFGGKNAEKLMKDIDEGLKSGLLTKSDAKTIMDLYDAEHKRYSEFTPEQQDLMKASRAASSLAAVQYLGMAVISSIPELAHMASRVGFVNSMKASPKAAAYFMKGLAQTLYPGKSGKYVKNAFAKDLIQTMGMAMNPTVNERIEAFFAGEINPFMNLWFRSLPGGFLTQYTNFVRAWTAAAGLTMIQNEANKLLGGRTSDKNMRALKRELRENGLTIEDFRQIARLGNGKIDFLEDSYMNQTFTKSDGTVTRIRDVLVPWLNKITTDVALEPSPSNRPLWMSNPKLQVVAQLKSFPVVFANNIMKRTYRQLNPKICTPSLSEGFTAYFSVAAAMGLGALAFEIKKAIRGSDSDTTLRNVLAASGIPYIDVQSFGQAFGIPAVSMVDTIFSPLLSGDVGKTLEEVMETMVRTVGGSLLAEQIGE